MATNNTKIWHTINLVAFLGTKAYMLFKGNLILDVMTETLLPTGLDKQKISA